LDNLFNNPFIFHEYFQVSFRRWRIRIILTDESREEREDKRERVILGKKIYG